MAFTVDDIKCRVIPVAEKYGVKSVILFGSCARGEACESSDVDILIDKGKIKGLIDYFSFTLDIEEALGCHADVITTGIEDKNFLDGIKREGVLLYEDR